MVLWRCLPSRRQPTQMACFHAKLRKVVSLLLLLPVRGIDVLSALSGDWRNAVRRNGRFVPHRGSQSAVLATSDGTPNTFKKFPIENVVDDNRFSMTIFNRGRLEPSSRCSYSVCAVRIERFKGR